MGEVIIRPTSAASGRVTPASFPFYTTGEDNLRITSYNAATGVSLKINARTLDAAGVAKADSWDHTPNTDRSVKVSDLTLSGSTLLNLTVFASAGAPLMGQTFVIVSLIRGSGAGAIVLGTVLQGYVTATQAIGWPGSPIQTSLESGGYYRSIVGATPAAGHDLLETCPTGARWELLEVEFQLFTIGAAGLRFPEFFIERLPNRSFFAWPDTAQDVGKNFTYYLNNAPKQTTEFDGTRTLLSMPLPPASVLRAGDTFQTVTIGMAVTDIMGPPQYMVREWLEP